eukprot:scaffold13863_cov35-Tisochrysis_lutea.AAC.6
MCHTRPRALDFGGHTQALRRARALSARTQPREQKVADQVRRCTSTLSPTTRRVLARHGALLVSKGTRACPVYPQGAATPPDRPKGGEADVLAPGV